MNSLTERLTDVFLVEPENSAKAGAFLLLLYVLTVFPAIAWMIASLLGRGASAQKVGTRSLVRCRWEMQAERQVLFLTLFHRVCRPHSPCEWPHWTFHEYKQ